MEKLDIKRVDPKKELILNDDAYCLVKTIEELSESIKLLSRKFNK